MALEKKLRAKFSLPDDHLAIISAAEKVITTNGIQIYGLRFVPEKCVNIGSLSWIPKHKGSIARDTDQIIRVDSEFYSIDRLFMVHESFDQFHWGGVP